MKDDNEHGNEVGGRSLILDDRTESPSKLHLQTSIARSSLAVLHPLFLAPDSFPSMADFFGRSSTSSSTQAQDGTSPQASLECLRCY